MKISKHCTNIVNIDTSHVKQNFASSNISGEFSSKTSAENLFQIMHSVDDGTIFIHNVNLSENWDICTYQYVNFSENFNKNHNYRNANTDCHFVSILERYSICLNKLLKCNC